MTNTTKHECEGHPADEFSPMGETVYCDGSCTEAETLYYERLQQWEENEAELAADSTGIDCWERYEGIEP